jgi:hypothetical protein
MIWVRRLSRYTAILLGVIILLTMILFLRVFALLTAIPELIGERASIESRFREFVYWLVNVDEVERFRDDMLLMMVEHMEDRGEKTVNLNFPTESTELDQWGLLRLIETGREDAKRRLREGEFLLSFVGAILALLVSEVFGLAYAGLLMPILLLVFSFLVSVRIVVTELLAYSSKGVDGYPTFWLLMMAGWNKNQIGHNTSMMIAAAFIVFSTSSTGYKMGMEIVDWFGARSNPTEERKWRVENTGPFDN